jgi:hypothetical protein
MSEEMPHEPLVCCAPEVVVVVVEGGGGRWETVERMSGIRRSAVRRWQLQDKEGGSADSQDAVLTIWMTGRLGW